MADEICILIAEDEIKLADSLKLGLEELNFKIDLAYDGAAAEKLFKNKSYNLIILDINLPYINGLELCKIIRAEQNLLPVLILTTYGSLDNKVEGFNAGADDYLVKPFEFKELILRISALLRRTPPQLQFRNFLTVADLEMNLSDKIVIRGGKQILLTAKEFQLLEYMLRNKNRVLSRADIAQQVWDIDFDTGTNIIDVYVNYLRKKIDKDFSYKLIHTQVGFGYMIKEE